MEFGDLARVKNSIKSVIAVNNIGRLHEVKEACCRLASWKGSTSHFIGWKKNHIPRQEKYQVFCDSEEQFILAEWNSET